MAYGVAAPVMNGHVSGVIRADMMQPAAASLGYNYLTTRCQISDCVLLLFSFLLSSFRLLDTVITSCTLRINSLHSLLRRLF